MAKHGGKRKGAGRPTGAKLNSKLPQKTTELCFADMLQRYPINLREPLHSLRRRVVAALTMLGLSSDEIAVVIALSPPQLDMAFHEERDVGVAVGRAAAITALFKRAVGDGRRMSVSAAIALLRMSKPESTTTGK